MPLIHPRVYPSGWDVVLRAINPGSILVPGMGYHEAIPTHRSWCWATVIYLLHQGWWCLAGGGAAGERIAFIMPLTIPTNLRHHFSLLPAAMDHHHAASLPPAVTIATAAASRRLPPPCWSHEETIALIDAYREKWYSLRRGNLRAVHWQEVAEDVAGRCPVGTPKTAVQCRHKMEKLRKRYRQEIQRAVPYGGSKANRYCSAWVHFKRMEAMEKGVDADDDLEPPEDSSVKKIGDIYKNNSENVVNGRAGFRIRIPGIRSVGADSDKVYSKFDEIRGQNPNPGPTMNMNMGVNYGFNTKVVKDGFSKRAVGVEVKKADPVAEMVAAIRVLGDGFVRMERMKMDMAREVEEMRMDMEMKRTEMILESQQRLVDAFANGIAERRMKKAKRMENSAEAAE